ncbi:MAG: AFG1 family ATPase [Maricaulaceae bacterium]|nr:AFG1 family ATPase [Maricaulaceae bacterium]
MSAPDELWRARVAAGSLSPDPGQEAAAKALSRLHADLAAWKPDRGVLRKAAPAPRGVYLWGGVGRGKSMLMDLLYEHSPVQPARRAHFHEFMARTHARIAAWRALTPKERKRLPEYVRGAGDDPIAPAAKLIASEARLLCFDEFQVTDIADAMILGRLFTALFDRGVAVAATSNRAPDDLYRDGLNRQLFLPFIALLKQRLEVVEIGGGADHRLAQLRAAPVYYAPLGPQAAAAMDAAWERLTQGAHPQAMTLTVQGRRLAVTRETAGVARFSFAELCEAPLGAADYLAIAARFHTVLLDGVPVLGPEKRNEAKRFVTLIDALYEAKTKLVVSAAAEPDALYPEGDGAFEFERCASRLFEMRSEAYLAAERANPPQA